MQGAPLWDRCGAYGAMDEVEEVGITYLIVFLLGKKMQMT